MLSSGKPYRRVRSWDIREKNMRIDLLKAVWSYDYEKWGRS